MPNILRNQIVLRSNTTRVGPTLSSPLLWFRQSFLLRRDPPDEAPERHWHGRVRRARLHGWYAAGTLRFALIGAFVLSALAGLPEASAGLVPPEHSGDQLAVRRLAEVRELLERQRALQRSLQGQVDKLAGKIDQLRLRLATTSTTLQSERQEALVLERRLDQLVPRFLARMAEARAHRAQAARALADLAGKSRSPQLDPRTRARMSALSPFILQRLGNAETGPGLVRELWDQTIERHAQIERRLPGLATEHERLQRLSSEHLRLRKTALEQLRVLQVEVELLGREQAKLARRFLREKAATLARAEPQADHPALPTVSAIRQGPGSAALRLPSGSAGKGEVDAALRATRMADAWDHTEARVGPAASAPQVGLGSRAVAVVGGAPSKPPYRHASSSAAFPGRTPRVQALSSPNSGATTLDVAFRREHDLAERRSGALRAGRRAAPILPLPEAVQDRFGAAHDGPELAFPAAPGQPVAAPVDGKVVFAGTFKSYGWLLILEHEREYHTLLWGFARLDVQRGDQVHVGQIVGIMDAQGEDPPVLHVEWRRNGRPIDVAATSNGIQG
jgi:septal ring factor EnvC (AmiA/AmiB activator)